MAEYSGSSGYAEYEYLGTANGTSFAKRHPYLLWQIIGWSILLADAVFFVVAALQDFGEWCYPVIVFPFIAALFAVIGVMAWQFTPFYMVYFIAGYGNIDTSLYEAAVIDGATRRQYLFKIAIPLLGPIFKTACTMSLIGSLKYFDMVWNMTQGGPAGGTELMATYMYKLSFQQFNMGYGSCVAAGMFILITLIALLFQKVFVVKEDY